MDDVQQNENEIEEQTAKSNGIMKEDKMTKEHF